MVIGLPIFFSNVHKTPYLKVAGIKNCNATLKTTKIKISAAPVDREKNSLELGAAGFFNLSELRMALRFL
jgi:hypothetical protein